VRGNQVSTLSVVFPGNGQVVDPAMRGATSRSIACVHKKPEYNLTAHSERFLLSAL
jgi:hypothetical protein